MRKLYIIMATIALCIMNMTAQDSIPRLRISLITCAPGPEIYELYGHTAIRVTDSISDMAYNYGMFDFNEPHFVYRFTKGETDYALGYYSFDRFLAQYVHRGSKVTEQVLNLTQQQAEAIYEKLSINALPQNRGYRYNYIYDNCATRPRDIIESVLGNIKYPEMKSDFTFRDEMRQYNVNYPWYQFGIDIALGSGIDYALTAREQMFVPLELCYAMGKATVAATGAPVVSETHVLYESSDATLPATPWYMTPLAISILITIITLIIAIRDIIKSKISRWYYSIIFLAFAITGCIVFFLIFVSSHAATSPNYLAVWLNPFCIIPVITIWIKSCQRLLLIYNFLNFVALILLMASWYFLPQTANVAFFLLMSCSAICSLTYILVARKLATNY